MMFQSLVGKLETENEDEAMIWIITFQSLVGKLETTL